MNYIKIDTQDVCNGDGLRVVLWLSGCSHHCNNCQNQQTWDPNSGIKFDENAEEEVFKELEKDYISGITFSGGDPLYKDNLITLYDLILKIKYRFPNKTIWLYTGYTVEQLFEDDNFDKKEVCENQFRRSIVLASDVLVDGEYKDDLRDVTLKWRGSSNQRVIDVKESLKQNKIIFHCD